MPIDPLKIFDSTHPVVRMILTNHRNDIKLFKQQFDNPELFQRNQFLKMVNRCSYSEFGEAYGLHKLERLEDIRHLPIRQYDAFEPWIKRIANGERNILSNEKVTGLMETSGTTGSAKLIPVTPSWRKGIQVAQRLWLLRLLCRHPNLIHTKTLNIVSSANERLTSGGIPVGANTGRMRNTQPWWAKGSYVLPDVIHRIPDPTCRAYARLRFALQEPIGIMVTANPSMLLRYARLLKEWEVELKKDLLNGTVENGPGAEIESEIRTELNTHLKKSSIPIGTSMSEIWPLQALACWKGGPASYFVDRIPEVLGTSVPIHEIGITASEGFFTLALHPDYHGGLFWAGGHLVEFIDADDNPHFCWELKEGESYRMVITTENGLWRYDLNDTVEVVKMTGMLPALKFVGKSGQFLNAVGEKVSGAHISNLMTKVCGDTGLRLTGFTGRLHWAEVPHLIVAIEPITKIEDNLADVLDNALKKINIEYASKRRSGRLNRLEVETLPQGSYHRHRLNLILNGAPDGQVKDFILAPNDGVWQEFLLKAGVK